MIKLLEEFEKIAYPGYRRNWVKNLQKKTQKLAYLTLGLKSQN